ncbi:hypothetical protein GWK47_015283 [Chionoecetes opilio]|uniref:Tesmin/TSO1-like CXC domain-containing protein n=1 Tax=Chionoecetes opilio TaxID=41210 RepID=A0A8J4XZ86_CHIOP|nr:hypothetical protein GWK47_015283 [Chionoecetes opilio]
MHYKYCKLRGWIWRESCRASHLLRTHDCRLDDIEDGKLAVNWMRGSPAPDAFMQLLSCKCVRSCGTPKCTCLSNGLKCTDMCRLQTCRENKAIEERAGSTTSEFRSDVDDIGRLLANNSK